jgi:hypothetical protein
MAKMFHTTLEKINSLHPQALLMTAGYKSDGFEKTVPSSLLTKKSVKKWNLVILKILAKKLTNKPNQERQERK